MAENETPAAPLNPDLAGYPSVDALVAGYRASSEEGKKWRERAETLDREFQARANAPNVRPEIPQRSTDPFSRLADYGIPADELRQAIRSEVLPAIREEFEPLKQGFAARTQIMSQHADYGKFEADVAQYVASDPQVSQTYNRMFQADPAGAMEYAFLKFGDSRRRTQPGVQNGAQESVHAAIPSARTGASRTQPQDEDNLRQAWEHYKETGNPEPFARARLKQVISDEFLNQ